MSVSYSRGGFLIGSYHGDLLRSQQEKHKEMHPCNNRPNFEVSDAEDGTYAYCLLGEENCDKETGEEDGV